MAIRVITVTPPAAGTDWLYTIPGQWVANLIGITATLTTTANPTQVVDTSGNARHATVNTSWPGTFQAPGPYAGGADNYCVVNAADGTPAGAYCARRNNADMAIAAAGMSVDYWARMDTANTTGANWGIVSNNRSGAANWEWDDFTGGGDPWDSRFTLGAAGLFTVANVRPLGTWVHLGHAWDGANWLTYRDGVLFNTHAGGAPGNTSPPNMDLAGSGLQAAPPKGAVAGIGIYNATLPAASFAAHAAASASAAAYQAAVLADAPVALWLMNDLISQTSRHANLEITDGTNTLLTVPAGFTITNAGTFQWSWQVLGPGQLQSVDGAVATVNVPEMHLPAGYTIGTRTLDIVSTDQWSAITITFDDGTGPAGGPVYGVGGAGYLNAMLVPDYSHRSLS